MNIERPGSPSATTVAPTSKRRSTSIETKRSRLASESPPKKGVASKNAFRSGELTAIDLIYARSQRRQAGRARRDASTIIVARGSGRRPSRQTSLIIALKRPSARWPGGDLGEDGILRLSLIFSLIAVFAGQLL